MRLSLDFVNPTWSGQVFREVRRFFGEAVERLGAASGFVGFRDGLRVVFDERFGIVMAADPPHTLRGYDWLQIVPSDLELGFVDGVASVAGVEGAARIVEMGPTPVQPLAQRDRLRAVLAPAIVRRSPPEPARNPIPEWVRRCLLATDDGGLPLGDAYDSLVDPTPAQT